MKISSITVASCIFLGSGAYSQEFKSDEIAGFKGQEIQVQILDNATSGCWTNMDTVKLSVEAELGKLGLSVVAASPYRVLINVRASRLESRTVPRLTTRGSGEGPRVIGGKCFGRVEIAAYSIEEAVIPGTMTVFGSKETIFTGFDDANQIALDFVQRSMSLFK